MIFQWILSDSKSPQVSRTLLSILADLNNAVVWMVSTRSFISKSSSSFINRLVPVPRAPIIIGINETFMFHSFFSSLVISRYLSFFSISFNFTQWLIGTAKSTVLQVLIFLLIIIEFGRLGKIKWSVWMSKSERSLCVILQDWCWVVHIQLVRMIKLKFLAQFPVDHITHSVVSCRIHFVC